MAKVIETNTRLMNAKDRKKVDRELKCQTRIPETLEEAAKMWAPEHVLNMAIDAYVVRKQAAIRGMLALTGEDRMTDKQILDKMAEWKLGQRKSVDPKARAEKIKNDFAKLDPAARKAILAELRQ